MSRQIDLSKPLSERDEQHLRQLGRTDLINQLKAGGEDSSVTAGPRQLKGEGLDLGPNTGDVNTLGRAETGGAVGRMVEQAPSEDEDEYTDLTVDELRDELERRDLPKTGKKAELQERLRAADAATPAAALDDEDDDEE